MTSRYRKLDVPLAHEFFKILAHRNRALKNEARKYRFLNDVEALAKVERAISELLKVSYQAEFSVSQYILTPQELIERRNSKDKSMSLIEFEAVKHFIPASSERIEALKSVLVDRCSYSTVAARYGWTRQAVGKTVKLFYTALEERADDVISKENVVESGGREIEGV